MEDLQIKYSKEFAKKLGQIAVYLPGTPIEVGDIITFPHGKSFFGKSKPLGTFRRVTTLKNLGVAYIEPKFSNNPDTYKFSSNNAVDFDFNIDSNADLGNDTLPSGHGKVKINFSSEGALYFLGVDCDKKQLDDLTAIEKEINDNGKNLVWEDTYLVTSITVAKKAFIAQSQSRTSELVIQGNVKGLNTKSATIKADSNLSVKKQKGNIFIKDWSDNVTVFMDLVKFEKEVFGENYRGTEATSNKVGLDFRLQLKPLSVQDIL